MLSPFTTTQNGLTKAVHGDSRPRLQEPYSLFEMHSSESKSSRLANISGVYFESQ